MAPLLRRLALPAVVLGGLCACTHPKAPEKERPVEPQATQLRDSIQAPIDKAKSVEKTLDDAANKQREAIDAAGG